MPELPDLVHIQEYIRHNIVGRIVQSAEVKQPIVLRVALEGTFESLLVDTTIADCHIHGPFVHFRLDKPFDLIVNLMLAGKLQHQHRGEKPEGYLCFSLVFDDDSRLNLCDEQQMAKAYLISRNDLAQIPRYLQQGINIQSTSFTRDAFTALAKKHARKQVRVFINDHTILSSIGNAYADEILFDAGIHPKTFVNKLSETEVSRLYDSIRTVMQWGIEKVGAANKPIHFKVRDHMKVRNRKDQPCPNCGTTIRREGVRGFDVFFCPSCQPASRKLFIDWNK